MLLLEGAVGANRPESVRSFLAQSAWTLVTQFFFSFLPDDITLFGPR